mmetsp:Transcript_19868/g.22737  ORF Transcript_19868/g.22737 Transcript_19868/m.22737 type:complete len:386 (-) Transcript_19868:214-1371(-)
MVLTMGTLFITTTMLFKTSSSFVLKNQHLSKRYSQLFSSAAAENGISRISTLQTLLSKHGAPGSEGCLLKDDLVPVTEQDPTLHPHLYAIAQSSKTGNYICALRRCYTTDDDPNFQTSSENAPWPIVESASKSRGMSLLALNSEHLMRRIACEGDFVVGGDDGKELVSIYNEGLGNDQLEKTLDTPYEAGSVEQLGYGCEKYVLLRVGPFPDLYNAMAQSHKKRGDESSSLIAAEASNGKFTGFGSTFLSYARLLSSFGTSRNEEARDGARTSLRLPLPSLGHLDSDFKNIAVLGQIATEEDSFEEALTKLSAFYEKLRANDESGPGADQSGKTEQQVIIDEANYLLDRLALTSENNADWSKVRTELAEKYVKINKQDMADFVSL